MKNMMHVFCRATTIAHISDEWLKEVDGDVFDETLGYKEWKKLKKPLKNKAKEVYNKPTKTNDNVVQEVVEETQSNYIIVTSEIEKQLQKRSDEIWEKFTEAEQYQILDYTNLDYELINQTLRGIRKNGVTWVDDSIKVMDNILNQRTIEKDLVLYRGVSKGELTSWKNRNSWETFLSTTIDKKIIDGFGHENYYVEIYAPKDTKGLYLGVHSDYEEEKEMLLHRNQKYKILEIGETFLKVEVLP